MGSEGKDEGNLLIEAVSLLVQRQRETETWIVEQMAQADERSATQERRYADLEARLSGIEEHLGRLVHDVGLPREPAVDDRLEQLRAQLAGLKATSATPKTTGEAEYTPVPEPAPVPRAAVVPPEAVTSASPPRPATPQPVAVAAAPATHVGFLDLLGNNTQDRAGLVMIAAGAVCVLTVLLTQIRVG